ncbi:MAG TPA: hypothetical protein VER58_16855 [Thermoanaerobaculia bacterium]|nr:hypothetical protein [Thermoanaerobaculia bacterium]
MNLHDAFVTLRREEAARAPRFDRMWHARPQRRLVPRFAFATMLLIVVALFFVVRRPEPPRPSISAWKAPTDFLLATPGRELLQRTPELRGRYQ